MITQLTRDRIAKAVADYGYAMRMAGEAIGSPNVEKRLRESSAAIEVLGVILDEITETEPATLAEVLDGFETTAQNLNRLLMEGK